MRDLLRSARFIAARDLKHLLRERDTLIWVFLMPPLFFYFLGTVSGGYGSPPSASDPAVPIAVIGEERGGFLLEVLVERLEALGYEAVFPETQEELDRYLRHLTIPEPPDGFVTVTDAVLAGEPVELSFLRSGDELAGNYDRVRVARAVYGVLADLAVVREQSAEATAVALDALADTPRSLTLEVETAGERVDPPTGFAQAVPGTTVMFTMLVMLTSGATLLVVERNQGLLRRLASTPISPGSVVLGKWAARTALGVLQIGYGMTIGSLLFRMDWGRSLPVLWLVLVAWAGFTGSLGLLLANLVRTEAQMAGLGVMTTMALAAFGGCWWPIEITPAWMQSLSLALPSGWTMDALHRLVSFGYGPSTVLGHLLALVAGALLLGAAAARTFRYQ